MGDILAHTFVCKIILSKFAPKTYREIRKVFRRRQEHGEKKRFGGNRTHGLVSCTSNTETRGELDHSYLVHLTHVFVYPAAIGKGSSVPTLITKESSHVYG